ncbi:hypothetical protein [Pseudomonas frederiksbergensis]|uniref:hypothetical protein n=1 Tax=Pseudomonas frederiksbergensis TaxID=104087 RepID=UPI003D2257FC
MLPSPSGTRTTPGHLHTHKWRARIGLALVAGLLIGALLEQYLGLKALFVSGLLAGTLGLRSLKIPRVYAALSR